MMSEYIINHHKMEQNFPLFRKAVIEKAKQVKFVYLKQDERENEEIHPLNETGELLAFLEDRTVYVKSNQFLIKHSLVNGCWITLFNNNNNEEEEIKQASVRVYLLKNDATKNINNEPENDEPFTLYIKSELLMFNLDLFRNASGENNGGNNNKNNNNNHTLSFKRGPNWGENLSLVPFGYFNTTLELEQPLIASSITISRVKSPQSNGWEDYSMDLREYFLRRKRLMRKNELFFIKVHNRSALLREKRKNDNANKPEGGIPLSSQKKTVELNQFDYLQMKPVAVEFTKVFFKITKVDVKLKNSQVLSDVGFDVFVDVQSEQTSIIQAGATSSKLPITQEQEEEEEELLMLGKETKVLESLIGPQIRKSKTFPILYSTAGGLISRAMVKKQVRKIAALHGVHFHHESLINLRGLTLQDCATQMEEIFDKVAKNSAPCVLLLTEFDTCIPTSADGAHKPDDPDLLSIVFKNKVGQYQNEIKVIATTNTVLREIPSILQACFPFDYELKPPDMERREEIVSILLQKLEKNHQKKTNVKAKDLASKTAGRSWVELKCLFSVIYGNTEEGSMVTLPDFDKALDGLPISETLQLVGAPKIPNVFWDDIGGLAHAKTEILDMIQLPMLKPELFAGGGRGRSGILLYGPPGTGKTLLAKAVATECAMNFISIKGPELLDMYVGESERKIRRVFETARASKPCILFFDELDSLAPQRGRGGSESGGVMDRVVSQLLTELDGMSNNSDVFIIAATNRPDLLDQSLLRPGRLDRLIYLGISKNRDDQLKILQALTRKYKHEKNVNLSLVLENSPLNLTGADFYSLASSAVSSALKRKVDEVKQQSKEKNIPPRKLLQTFREEDLHVVITMEDYLQAGKRLIPSVSTSEIEKYEKLKEKFSIAMKQ